MAIVEKEALKVSLRMLQMVHEKDHFFTLLDDDLIGHLILEDYIHIDLSREDMEGTSLTDKGKDYLKKHFNLLEVKSNFKVAKNKLKHLLEWSDRLGSDERHEISSIIKLL